MTRRAPRFRPGCETLEAREVPAALAESFEAVALPAGFAQWSRSGADAFVTSTQTVFDGGRALAATGTVATESRFWSGSSQPADTDEGNRWDDAHEYHQRFASAAATALQGSPARVVAASAGRHGYDDHGIVAAFSAVENTLNASGATVRHLRSAFFMENLLEALPTLAAPGAVFFNGPGDLPLPMVCVADVAHKAVDSIVDRSWQGQGHVAVHGPAHVSFDEMAGVLTDVLATPIRYIQVPDQVLIDNMTRVGLPEGFASAFARLLTKDALHAYDIEPRTPETTTPTTLHDWAGQTLLPAFKAFTAR